MNRTDIIQTYIPRLDTALGGGIKKGAGVGIYGSHGVGKTILCMQMAYNNIIRSKTCTFHTHDQNTSMLIDRMKSFGWDPEPYMKYFHIMDWFTMLAPTEDELDDEPLLSLEKALQQKLDFRVLLSRSNREMRKKFGRLPDLLILDSATPLFMQLGGRNLYLFFRMAVQLFLRNSACVVTIHSDSINTNDLNALSSLSNYFLQMKKDTQDTYSINIEKSRNKIETPIIRYSITSEGLRPLILGSIEGRLSHPQLIRRNMLLEFDSASPYERCVRDFVMEAASQEEGVTILTTRGSPIWNSVEDISGIELILLAPNVRISSILDRHADKPLTFVYDSLSDLILTTGFDSAYAFTRFTLEKFVALGVTGLFLLNPDAHSSMETSSIRGLFSNQFRFGNEGLVKIRSTF